MWNWYPFEGRHHEGRAHTHSPSWYACVRLCVCVHKSVSLLSFCHCACQFALKLWSWKVDYPWFIAASFESWKRAMKLPSVSPRLSLFLYLYLYPFLSFFLAFPLAFSVCVPVYLCIFCCQHVSSCGCLCLSEFHLRNTHTHTRSLFVDISLCVSHFPRCFPSFTFRFIYGVPTGRPTSSDNVGTHQIVAFRSESIWRISLGIRAQASAHQRPFKG